jgi:hypothetical protein
MLASCGPSLEQQARDGLRDRLKDASSAQFINLRKTSLGQICGQVNAKNSYGAFPGFSHFYVWPGAGGTLAQVDDEERGSHLAREICKSSNKFSY